MAFDATLETSSDDEGDDNEDYLQYIGSESCRKEL